MRSSVSLRSTSAADSDDLASPAVAGYAKAGEMESPRALARGAPRGAFSKAYGGAI